LPGRFWLLPDVAASYQLNLKRTWIWRGSMFCVDTCDGKTLPKFALFGSVLMVVGFRMSLVFVRL
jgi:hypothetical protein